MSSAIIVERSITPARRAELGVDGWPLWKDRVGSRTLTWMQRKITIFWRRGGSDAGRREPVTVGKGDLVIIPAAVAAGGQSRRAPALPLGRTVSGLLHHLEKRSRRGMGPACLNPTA